jgi:predicted phage terminase large subunit-like protein
MNDLAGYLLDAERNVPGADQWTVFSIPAILDDAAAAAINNVVEEALNKHPEIAGYVAGGIQQMKGGDSFCPRRMSKKFLLESKGNMSERDWGALYMQRPTEEEGAIIKRKWWRKWSKKEPPRCEYILQCYDTAFEANETADPSARTTWGVFAHNEPNDPEDKRYSLILLDRWKERVEFPELRDECMKSYKHFKPDRILIEKRASGHTLIQELRRARIPVKGWLPPGVRGAKGKIPRAYAAQVVFEQGAVFYMDRNWATEVIDQAAAFPFGPEDDLVDTVTMATDFLRRTFWLDLKSDVLPEDEEEERNRPESSFKGYGS